MNELDTRHHPNELPPPTHNGHAMIIEHADNDIVDSLAAWGDRTRGEAEEKLAEIDRAMNSDSGTTLDDFWKMRDLIERGHLVLRHYIRKGGNRDMAERCLWLNLGFPTLAGASSLAELVKKLGIGKATINKCLQNFQKQIPELSLLPGQRDWKARSKMKSARINQITTQHEK